MLLCLVISGSSLASLELLKVITANVQVVVLLLHTSLETLNIVRTWPGCFALLGSARVVEAVVLGVVVNWLLVLLLSWGSRRATAEEATDGVTYRRTDCDTTGEVVSLNPICDERLKVDSSE